MDELRALWSAHMDTPMPPGFNGESVDGVELSLLDADIAGCVQTCLTAKGRLDRGRSTILAACYRDARRVIPLVAPDVRSYVERLARMAELMLIAVESSHRAV